VGLLEAAVPRDTVSHNHYCQQEKETELPPADVADINVWSIASVSPYIFIVCYTGTLIQHHFILALLVSVGHWKIAVVILYYHRKHKLPYCPGYIASGRTVEKTLLLAMLIV
jgi:hypothetical protein